MPSFSSRNVSRATVPAPRDAIWDVVTDPDLLAELTPLLDRIDVDGEHWTWQLGGIAALGVEVAPSFTERMTFEPRSCLRFTHDPPAGVRERAGAEGVYELRELDAGTTELGIDLTLTVELPLPQAMRGAVERVMATSMARTGDLFAQRLYAHLGVDPAAATTTTVAD